MNGQQDSPIRYAALLVFLARSLATAGHKAEALCSTARGQVAVEIENAVRDQVASRGIVIERVLLRDVQLPPALKTAIEIN
jgi:regulator of protease activity HflC (stomatin/prohibitin superfamily)